MKTFTKIMLILAGVFGTIGVVCVLIAFVMGFSAYDFTEMIENGDLSIKIEDGKLNVFGYDAGYIIEYEDSKDDINEEDDEDVITYKAEECHSMDVKFGAGLLEVHYANVDEIQVKHTNIPNLKVKVKDGTLVVSDRQEISIGMNQVDERKLVIMVPYDFCFEEVKIEVGAGQGQVEQLQAKELELKVGAGQLDIEISGAEADYNYNVACGIGQVVVGKHSWEGVGATQNITNDGADCHMNIECGVGQVNMHFTCDAENGICDDESYNHNGHNSNNHH